MSGLIPEFPKPKNFYQKNKSPESRAPGITSEAIFSANRLQPWGEDCRGELTNGECKPPSSRAIERVGNNPIAAGAGQGYC